MSFSDFANFVGRRAVASGKGGLARAYDDLAGLRLLRRARRAAPPATLLSAREKADAEDRISRQLRDFYQSLTREPVPERFMQLIADLEAGNKR